MSTQKKTESIHIRVHAEVKAAIAKQAEKDGIGLTRYILATLIDSLEGIDDKERERLKRLM